MKGGMGKASTKPDTLGPLITMQLVLQKSGEDLSKSGYLLTRQRCRMSVNLFLNYCFFFIILWSLFIKPEASQVVSTLEANYELKTGFWAMGKTINNYLHMYLSSYFVLLGCESC